MTSYRTVPGRILVSLTLISGIVRIIYSPMDWIGSYFVCHCTVPGQFRPSLHFWKEAACRSICPDFMAFIANLYIFEGLWRMMCFLAGANRSWKEICAVSAFLSVSWEPQSHICDPDQTLSNLLFKVCFEKQLTFIGYLLCARHSARLCLGHHI